MTTTRKVLRSLIPFMLAMAVLIIAAQFIPTP